MPRTSMDGSGYVPSTIIAPHDPRGPKARIHVPLQIHNIFSDTISDHVFDCVESLAN